MRYKTYLFSEQIRMLLANELESLVYTDIVFFITIGKLFIYQHKSLSKLATDLSPNILKPERATNKHGNWLPTYLCISTIDIWLTNKQGQYISHITNSHKKHCI
jgi:hypothetical protein